MYDVSRTNAHGGTSARSRSRQSATHKAAVVLALAWIAVYLVIFYTTATPNGTARARAVGEMVVEAAVAPGSAAPEAQLGAAALTQRLWLMSMMLVLVVAAGGWGNALLRALRLTERLTLAEQVVLSYGAGTALLSLGVLLMGAVGLMQPATHATLLLAGPAVAAVTAWRGHSSGRRFVPIEKRAPQGTEGSRPVAGRAAFRETAWFGRCVGAPVVWLLPALLLIGLILAAAMLPPDGGHQYFDIKEYHLEAPKEYFLQGRITMLPHNVYTSMPLGTEMLSLLAMIVTGDWWWGALVGQTFLSSFAPATAALLYIAGRRFFSAAAGTIAALLYLGTPAIFEVSATPYVEGALCFYLVAAVYVFAIARGGAGVAGQAGAARRATATGGLYLLAGLLAGAAAACKYPGAVYVVLPLGVACALPPGAQRSDISRTRATVLFLSGTAVTFGPWLVRSAIDTGNPVYPLLWSVFGGRGWSAAQDARWWRVHGPPGFSWRELGTGIWQVGVGGTARSPLNPLLLGWAPLALLEPGSRRRAARWGAYVLFVLVAWWSATHRIDRFWYPVLPLLALLAGAGGAWVARQISSRLTATLVLASLCVVAGQCVTSHPLWGVYGRRLYALDVNKARGAFTKPIVSYLNHELPADAVVLAVGEAAVFDFRRKVFYSTAFDDRMFDRWLSGASGSELARLGITHVYVDWAEIARYRSAGNYGFTDMVVPELLDDLVRREVLGQPEVWIYEVDSLPPASRQVFQQWDSLRVASPEARTSAVVYALYRVRARRTQEVLSQPANLGR